MREYSRSKNVRFSLMHEMEKDIISVNMEGFIKTFGKEG